MGTNGPSWSSIRNASRSVRGSKRRRSATDPGIGASALNRAVDGRIASAAANVAGQTGLDGALRRPRTKRNGGENHAGGADAALRAAELDERPLERVPAAQALDGRDVRPADL